MREHILEQITLISKTIFIEQALYLHFFLSVPSLYSFFQLIQPGFYISFPLLVMMVNSKINPNLFIIYSACLFFIVFRLFIFNEDLLSKTFGLTFLVVLFFLIDKKTVLLCLDKILIVFIFHLIFSQLLIFLYIGIYQIIYSSREVVDLFRSNKFFFPEASYLARVSALLGAAIYLNKDTRKMKPKVIFSWANVCIYFIYYCIILGSILIF